MFDYSSKEENLKEFIEKMVFEAQNESFDKTKDLMEFCLGVICKLIAEGFPLSLLARQIGETWKKIIE